MKTELSKETSELGYENRIDLYGAGREREPGDHTRRRLPYSALQMEVLSASYIKSLVSKKIVYKISGATVRDWLYW